MLALNDVQKGLLADLRGGEELDRDPDPEEIEELELMALMSEDTEMAREIQSILEYLDE